MATLINSIANTFNRLTSTASSTPAAIVDTWQTADELAELRGTIRTAFQAFAAENGQWTTKLVNLRFYEQQGVSILDAYRRGSLTRHEAAVALTQEWVEQHKPAQAVISKQRKADVALAIDSYLVHFGRNEDRMAGWQDDKVTI